MIRVVLVLLRSSLALFLMLSILLGLIYPAFITGVAQLFFSQQANGSLTQQGSTLIGQPFNQAKYFWGRMSATTPFPYNAAASSGSNLGPTNPALLAAVKQRIHTLKKASPKNQQAIPVDLVTNSGSGLDPDISPAAAYYQIARVAHARGLTANQVASLVQQLVKPRQFYVLGEPRVNVLQLNLALDQLQKNQAANTEN